MELASHELFTVKGEAGLGLREHKNGRPYFYSVEVSGYISEKNDSRSGILSTAAEQEAHGAAKLFLERGLSAGVLRFKERMEMWMHPSGSSGVIYVHQYDDADRVERRFSKALPQDFASVVRRVTFGIVSASDENGYRQLLESFLKICYNDNDTAKSIRTASEWRLDSLSDPSDAMRLVKVCIGLESIFGDQNNDSGLTRSLADRCAYSLALTHDERASIIDKCRELYQSRSKIVHGVANRLDDKGGDLLVFGDKILSRAISRESGLLPAVKKDGIDFYGLRKKFR